MNNLSRSNISVENATAPTAVWLPASCLRFDDPAFGADLRRWIDSDNPTTTLRNFVIKHRSDLRPRSVVNCFGLVTSRQACDVEVFNGHTGKAFSNAV